MRSGALRLTLCAAMVAAFGSHAWAQSDNNDGAVPAAAGAPSPMALGDSAADLVYTPVNPCRVVDTRIAGGVIPAGTQRAFRTTGSGFTAQGGSAGSCGVPVGATAAFINLVSVNPGGAGDFRVFPAGGAVPASSILNYTTGLNLANGVIVTLCDPAAGACPNDFTIQADVSASHLVADVGGYFRRVQGNQNGLVWGAAHVNGAAPSSVTRAFSRLPGSPTVTVTRLALGTWEVNFGGDISTRFFSVNPGNQTSGTPAAAFCDATPRITDANAIFVRCQSAAATLVDTNFFVQVF
jgi:hypothetical protein